jgi:hypothetical protein
MNPVTQLPTQPVKDAESINRMIDGLVAAKPNMRAGVCLYFDLQGFPHISYANTTLSDESYMIALMQERLMRLLAD